MTSNVTTPAPDACKPPYTKDNPYCCTSEDYLQCDGECFGTTFQGDLDWYHFLLSSIGTWLAAALIVLIPRLIYAPLKSRQDEEAADDKLLSEPSLYQNIQTWAGEMISGSTTSGRVLVCFSFLCNMVAIVIYIKDTGDYNGLRPQMKSGVPWNESVWAMMDFILAVFFFVYFWLRYIAAEDKLKFVFSMESVVDYFTIPPLILAVYSDTTWLGLRFFRCIIVLKVTDVLVFVRIIESSSAIKLGNLCSKGVMMVLVSAGMIHLLENTGDPWRNYCNHLDSHMGFGDCIYFLLITMSTVGYGDYSPQTEAGKLYLICFLFFGIVFFANSMPEIGAIIGNRQKYAGEYVPDGRQFIVVAGNINYETVQTFLQDFFHPARDDVDVEVLFLNKAEPDLEFEGLLKREHTRVQYFKGSMLNTADLQRVRAEKAAACLILADKFCDEPDSEDAANIMRVISLKNYFDECRVILQLMQYHNKGLLLNIPGWDWRRDDQAVCLNELKLGFIAQSCFAPGFSTLVSNLVLISTPKYSDDMPEWKTNYFKSCDKYIMAETLSPTFVGLQFKEVADICYSKLNLLLLAMEARKYEGGDIFINPRDKIINPNAIGLFITDSADSAKRAWFYCRKCHENIRSEKQVMKCSCKRTAVRLEKDYRQRSARHKLKKHNKMADEFLKQQVEYLREDGKNKHDPNEMLTIVETDGNIKMSSSDRKGNNDTSENGTFAQSKMQYDSTGMFHWCPSRKIDDCLMDRQEAAMTVLQDHVIVAVFANEDSPLIGLRNLVMPLRASNIPYTALIQVVLVGNIHYIKREWHLLKNLPKVSCLNGDPLSRADLRAVKIDMCRMCVVLSAKTPSRLEPVLTDKEVILASLNIKSMAFSNTEYESQNGSDGGEADTQNTILSTLDAKAPLASSETVGDSVPRHNSMLGSLIENTKGSGSSGIPLIVDLAFASNIRFLDEHELHLNDPELYKTLPFAAGMAVARGILDSLMSTTYFNASALRLIRLWVTGGATIELELALAEGAGLRGGYSTPESLEKRDRFRVEKVTLKGSVFSNIAEGGYPFYKLFSKAITYGSICIGLYRKPNHGFLSDDNMRIVITAPDKDLLLQEDDIAFMLVQYDKNEEEENSSDRK